MIAHRFSGDLRIRLTYLEPYGAGDIPPAGRSTCRDGEYRCYIRPHGFRHDWSGATIYVGLPAFLDRAVDAPETIDGIARAALAFAADEGWPVDTYAASNESGYLVTRKGVRR